MFAILVGLASGLSSGLFGVGGGIVMVPAMVLWLGSDVKRAIGTSLAVIVPTSLVSAWKHQTNGNIDWTLAVKLVPMALVGGYLGAWMVQIIPREGLKKAFGLFLVGVGFYLYFSDQLLNARPSGRSPTNASSAAQ